MFDFLSYVWDLNTKGGDIILRACKNLFDKGYRFRYLFIGNAETKSFIGEKYSEYSEFLVVKGAESDINVLLERSKVFISASRRETFSYAVCEAAYAGLPVISSRIPGLAWASEMPTVEFFTSEDADSLSEIMALYLDGKRASPEAVGATRKIIKDSFSVEHWAKQIYSYYGI